MRDHPRGPHAVWRWEWNEVELVPVEESGGSRGVPGPLRHRI
ncbi:MAG TPA: hypothetical protein VFR13_00695 [Jiangellaceae bacterium]|nr:hypothetical protein [Jiangellaceae bacterium]